MSHEIETMAFTGAEKPWHGLGERVDGDLTPDEMLVKAGLNWHVSRRLVRMRKDPNLPEEMVIKGYHAIVRDTDNTVFQIASDRYKPIQNNVVLGFFEDYCRAGGMTLETAGSLKGGAVIWGLAKIGADFTLAGGDKVDGYLLLANSHDGSLSFNALFTSVRVVCWNTLSSALSQGSKKGMFRMRHSKQWTDAVAADAKNKLGLARQEMEALKQAADFLSHQKVKSEQLVREYIIQLTNPNLLEDIVTASVSDRAVSQMPQGVDLLGAMLDRAEADERSKKVVRGKITEEDMGRVGRAIFDSILTSPGSELPSATDTWWGVVNGVTHFADHCTVRGTREADTAMQSAWFGQKATMKRDALELAIQFAEGKQGAN